MSAQPSTCVLCGEEIGPAERVTEYAGETIHWRCVPVRAPEPEAPPAAVRWRRRRTSLSDEAQEARRPRPPAELVGALQDPVPIRPGRRLSAVPLPPRLEVDDE